jgi:nucleoside 2-deoxyribosyltransferase
VAYYCSLGSLPVPKDIQTATAGFIANPTPAKGGKQHRVYLAGPLFNVPERWFVSETKRCLENCGLSVFSPLHDVGTGGDAVHLAKADLKGFDGCNLLFALLDGLDAGTLFEIGYAAARGVPVVAYGERVSESDLTMLKGTGTQVFNDYCTAIYQAAWRAMVL